MAELVDALGLGSSRLICGGSSPLIDIIMFIKEFYLKDKSICDDLITYFDQSNNKTPGVTINSLRGSCVDKSVKDSTDVSTTLYDPNPAIQKYLKELTNITTKYRKNFPMLDEYASWGLTEGFNIQFYKPGQGYHHWHTENCSRYTMHRCLAWMTYLNDVYIGGGTRFYHQKKTIWARKGKTVIWPTDWSYTHKGITAPFENKYIITGWFGYA